MVSAKSAWLAHYYPVEYMTAILNSYINNADRIKIYMSKCNEKGIKVLPPHVNYSQSEFSVDSGNIRFGLQGIKNMGAFSSHLINVREARGQFHDYQHTIVSLARHHSVNKKVVESLIYSGALDEFEGTRQAKLEMMEDLLELGRNIPSAAKSNRETWLSLALLNPNKYSDLQDAFSISTPEVEEFNRRLKLEKELEYAGFYITEHPIDEYAHLLVNEGVEDIAVLLESGEMEEGETNESTKAPQHVDLTADEEDEDDSEELMAPQGYEDGDYVQIAGVIKAFTVKYSAKDQKPFAIFEVEDRTGTIKIVMFNDAYMRYLDVLKDGNVVKIGGQYSVNDFGVQVRGNRVIDLERHKQGRDLTWIQVMSQPDMNVARDQYRRAMVLTHQYPGETPVMFYNSANQQTYQLPQGLHCSVQTLQDLKWIFGEACTQFIEQKQN